MFYYLSCTFASFAVPIICFALYISLLYLCWEMMYSCVFIYSRVFHNKFEQSLFPVTCSNQFLSPWIISDDHKWICLAITHCRQFFQTSTSHWLWAWYLSRTLWLAPCAISRLCLMKCFVASILTRYSWIASFSKLLKQVSVHRARAPTHQFHPFNDYIVQVYNSIWGLICL